MNLLDFCIEILFEDYVCSNMNDSNDIAPSGDKLRIIPTNEPTIFSLPMNDVVNRCLICKNNMTTEYFSIF